MGNPLKKSRILTGIYLGFGVEEFIRYIREDKPVIMSSSQDALKVMEIIEKAYEDAKSKTSGPAAQALSKGFSKTDLNMNHILQNFCHPVNL